MKNPCLQNVMVTQLTDALLGHWVSATRSQFQRPRQGKGPRFLLESEMAGSSAALKKTPDVHQLST